MSILSVVGEIDRCGRAFNALTEIERLHARALVWEGRRLRAVCVLCCLDTGGYRTEECEESHTHTADGSVCSTTEIIARAGL